MSFKVILAEAQDLLPGHKKTRVVIQSMQDVSDERSQYMFLQETSVYRLAYVAVCLFNGIKRLKFISSSQCAPLSTYLRQVIEHPRSQFESFVTYFCYLSCHAGLSPVYYTCVVTKNLLVNRLVEVF